LAGCADREVGSTEYREHAGNLQSAGIAKHGTPPARATLRDAPIDVNAGNLLSSAAGCR
jgi:hypothetical protein